jgi:Bifunctional DNA primase/polymerase, N-terminal/Primase C terminal 1 (PriCT-1)
MSKDNRLLTAALAYARKGFAVIPLHSVPDGICSCGCSNPACNSRGKHPRIAEWQIYPARDEARIHELWGRWPDANVGIVTGAVSGNVVLDEDPRNGGQESLAELQLKYGPIPSTREAFTGGGGRHFYFLHPGFQVSNSSGAVGPGLDVKGDGGYVVAPPSLHFSGRRYSWVRNVDIATAPSWLLDACRKQSPSSITAPEEWVRLIRDGATDGARNATATRLAGHLLRRRIDPFVALEIVRTWNECRCRPPLDDKEVERVVDSIANAEARRLSRWRRA